MGKRSLCHVLVGGVALLGLASHAAAINMFNFEVREPNSIFPPISRYVYVCELCTLAEFSAVVEPAGWEKADPKIRLFDDATSTIPTPPAGVAPALDLVPTIPGDDFLYVAQVLSGVVVAFDPVIGLMALAQVERQTVFTYNAGTLVHEVHDTSGNTYILFTINVDEDLNDVGSIPRPFGWTYGTRVLTSDLIVPSNGQATVFAQGSLAAWQLLPEPGVAALLAAAALGVGLARRRRA